MFFLLNASAQHGVRHRANFQVPGTLSNTYYRVLVTNLDLTPEAVWRF